MTPERIHNVILLGPSYRAAGTSRIGRDPIAADRSRAAHLANVGGMRLIGRWRVRDHREVMAVLCGPMGRQL